MFLIPLTLLGCDAVQPELLDSELANRDLQIEALTTRLDALEATVASQADTIAAQDAALAALGQSVADGDAALGARVDALEGTDSTVLATLDLHAATFDAHASALDDDAARLDGLDGAVADLGARTGVLEDDDLILSGLVASQGLGIVAAEARLGLIEGTLSGLDLAGVGARLDDIDGRVGLLEDQRDAAGETWELSVDRVATPCIYYGPFSWVTVDSVNVSSAVDSRMMVFAHGATELSYWRIRVASADGTTISTTSPSNSFPYNQYLSFDAGAGGSYTVAVQVENRCGSGSGATTARMYVTTN